MSSADKRPIRRGSHRRLGWVLVVIVGLCWFSVPAYAEDGLLPYQQMKEDLVPIQQLFSRVHEEFDGTILEVEFEQEELRVVYEVKVLTPQGNVLELEYDAKTLALLTVEGQRDDPHLQHDRP